jgi:Fur family ferric uptake transcriptional regulator
MREVFEGTRHPLTANEVLAAAQRAHPRLGIATVYRYIRVLLDEGWLTTVELPGEPVRYEVSHKEHHHHFRCSACGRIWELNGCVDGLRKLAPPGFVLHEHLLVLFGLCTDCAQMAATA